MDVETTNVGSFTLERDVWGQLVLTCADGRRVEGVEVARAFPISAPETFISICDAEGHEVMCIEKPDELPAGVREVIDRELARREFVPIVVRIVEVFAQTDPSEWLIVTDRGPTTFLMDDSDVDVRQLGADRVLLVDTHGIHYVIPDVRRLDGVSRRILDRYL
jgi:hypothetical protein